MIDLHTHTVFCDGKSTPEEMIISAIEKGVKTLGLTTHCYTPFMIYGGLSETSEDEFIKAVTPLKERYKDKIEILIGVEADYHADTDLLKFDYSVASSHYFYEKGKYYPIDASIEHLSLAFSEGFDGDVYRACERYFEQVVEIAKIPNCRVVGHFDLITKFNLSKPFFDENHPRYKKAWQKAALEIIKMGKVFEVNTGGISRGYKKTPYPSKEMVDFIKANGGKLMLSSDAHSASGIAFEFDKWKKEYDL